MTCVQCQVGFRGVASCCQVSYCQDVICSLSDGLCTVSGGVRWASGGVPAVVRSHIVKMLFVRSALVKMLIVH